MPSSSFSNKKELMFVITLGTGTFGSSSNNQIMLRGYRASVAIDKAGGQMMSTLRAQIYGVSQADMNSVTTLRWKPRSLILTTISVYAIDGNQQTLIFQGNIVNAWANYQNQPDVLLEIQAQAAYFNQLQPVSPLSYKGQIDVSTIMGQIASNMGYAFENNGVTTQLSNAYLPGTSIDQAKSLARAAGIDMYLDDNILAITPPDSPRAGLVPQISPQSGLIGYPTFDGTGVNFQILFNPAVRFGGSIQVVTSIPQAAGTWIVTSIAH